MKKEIKTIIIKQEITEDNTKTTFRIKGFTDFEVMGLLSYYNDIFKVESIQENQKQNKQ